MTRLFIATIAITVIAASTSAAHAQWGGGLPMTDQLGSGSASQRSTFQTPRSTPSRNSNNRVQRNNNNYRPNNNYRQPTRQISPQQIQQIANAAAALGPAIQQVRQNMQQIRAQNGGYLIPRNNNGGFGNGRIFQGQQPSQRFGDYFSRQGANQVRQDLMRSGYQNVQVIQHPHNQYYGSQPNRQRWGVHFGNRGW